MALIDQTLTLLENALSQGMSLPEIAPPGGPVEYEWLKKFSARKIRDPSVNRIQALHDRLQQVAPLNDGAGVN